MRQVTPTAPERHKLVDDLDGGDADETVKFSLDGVQYEIELATANADKLQNAFAPYTASGQKLGRRVHGSAATRASRANCHYSRPAPARSTRARAADPPARTSGALSRSPVEIRSRRFCITPRLALQGSGRMAAESSGSRRAMGNQSAPATLIATDSSRSYQSAVTSIATSSLPTRT
ncbi:Lsr2 family protein [Plantactinospora endophytica]|uniref:histone-like nucleoid-structuring protein Lsr2 n=1 Tax=Plantactinospora endophytica TaxID=673535 RepID=UPI001944BC9E|nr:Lsr2 family protein [Plantactinospora endophytica]